MPQQRQQPTPAPARQSPTSLHLWLPDDHALLASASTLVATIDSDIASIPEDEFGRVFAGAGVIILGSLLSLVFVGYLIESGGMYADLVAETYVEQDFMTNPEGDKQYLDSLGLDEEGKREAEEMVRAFREKKMRKAGTWTEEEEEGKQQLLEEKNEKDMFSDYD